MLPEVWSASLAMNQFQALWGKLMANEERPHGAQSLQQGSPDTASAANSRSAASMSPMTTLPSEPETPSANSSWTITSRNQKKRQAGAIAHYAMGAASGAIYGAVAEMMPVATVAEGLPFGASVWLVADEAIVPARRPFQKTQRIPGFNSRLRSSVAPRLWADN